LDTLRTAAYSNNATDNSNDKFRPYEKQLC
jgi:hypothetical protein